MFLNELNDQERYAFFELAYRIAHADGDLAQPESLMLAQYRLELAAPDYEVQGLEIADAAQYFESDASKRGALLELMMVAMADGVAHPLEHELLRETEMAMGIDSETADSLFAWVQRLCALIATGQRLVEAGDPYASAR